MGAGDTFARRAGLEVTIPRRSRDTARFRLHRSVKELSRDPHRPVAGTCESADPVKPFPPSRNARVLVVGHSAEWRARISKALSGGPFVVEELTSGRKALEALAKDPAEVELLLTDAHSSDVSGVALCRCVRELPGGDAITLVIVSALGDEMDRILAFENGADDFVTEPFFPRELAARVRSLTRRRRLPATREPRGELEAGVLRLDLRAGLVEVQGERVRLTQREFEVLRQLVLNEGRVVQRADLLRELTSEGRVSPRLIDTHVKSIRHKLGAARDFIETVRGVGYRFDAERS